MSRVFEITPAVRARVPVLVAVAGGSGSGKTYSALRLAAGIQRVVGGDIHFIDTEGGRALHYADHFKFLHVPFVKPFSSMDYLDVIQHCISNGARTIVIDSMSHEHEGSGGYLELHESEVTRLCRGDESKREVNKMSGWTVPSQERRKLINEMIGMGVNFVLCFRAKDKVKPVKGKGIEQIGWVPIGGADFVFEMTLKCLLLPGSNGTPIWESDYIGEQMMMKLPLQFKELFAKAPQLTEDIGEKIAAWASGGKPHTAKVEPVASPAGRHLDLCHAFDGISDRLTFTAREADRSVLWPSLDAVQRKELKAASDRARDRMVAPSESTGR